ncbi:hypothetical protein FHS43_000942 [Streptosporangium becharense]|uniref:Uncharacterized protein n=1 Tax=Streptosporangium becharense TaxID=1816182 RepID=A0A7W9IEU1_9ACTN|nr:hypothetical protein [Streptosporangium becharense]MBB5819348.1 hypothetical protein [Streptosporangium becharense]
MIWFLLALAVVSVLAPLIGADTRDGRDWQPVEPVEPAMPSWDDGALRTSDSPVRAPAARERVAAHRPRPAAG